VAQDEMNAVNVAEEVEKAKALAKARTGSPLPTSGPESSALIQAA
jgi:hypothetical protein